MEQSDATKPPAFWCPKCGQKHRADLTLLERHPGSSVRTACRRCGAALRIRLEDGKPMCTAAEAPPVKGPPVPEVVPEEEPEPAPAESERAFQPGERTGRYTVRALLRRGKTSTVYRAHDPKTKREVALKVLRADAPKGVRRRFLRQVDVQAHIRHPHVIPIYDRGSLEDGRPFFTMELLHQPVTLAYVLAQRAAGRLAEEASLAPLAELRELVARILLPVADGVYVANVESGVLHGDLQPENVLIDGQTLRPYVTDFGRASALEAEGRSEAERPLPHRASPYLAPEQAGGETHARTDVWGLGALLHAVLSGRTPLTGRGRTLLQNAAAGHYTPLPEDAPPALVAITRKATAVRPEDRYVNARQMAVDLRAWQEGGRIRALEEFGGPAASALGTRQAIRRHLRVAAWILGGLALGLLLGSRIRIGKETPGAHRLEVAAGEVDRLGQELTRIAAIAATIPPDEARALWHRLGERIDAIEDRLTRVPPSGARASVESQVAFVRQRIEPRMVRLEAPPGTRVVALHVATGRTTELEPGLVGLPPGRYEMRAGRDARIRFPVRIGLVVRPVGQDPGSEPPRATWSIPIDPAVMPRDSVLVIGHAVRVDRPPYSAPSPLVPVGSFLMDRDLVTNEQYAAFLAALPAAERAERTPAAGFVGEGPAPPTPAPGAERAPVVGIRPADARAYCAWRSADSNATVRLPTEAEWVLACGSPWMRWRAGAVPDAAGQSPFGVNGLLVLPREMVTGVTGRPGADDVLAKGPEAPETPLEQALYDRELLDAGRRDTTIGFRCVQEP